MNKTNYKIFCQSEEEENHVLKLWLTEYNFEKLCTFERFKTLMKKWDLFLLDDEDDSIEIQVYEIIGKIYNNIFDEKLLANIFKNSDFDFLQKLLRILMFFLMEQKENCYVIVNIKIMFCNYAEKYNEKLLN